MGLVLQVAQFELHRNIPSQFHSTWMDNSKAKYLLEWQPKYNMEMLIDSAWQYERSQTDPRIVWYPG